MSRPSTPDLETANPGNFPLQTLSPIDGHSSTPNVQVPTSDYYAQYISQSTGNPQAAESSLASNLQKWLQQSIGGELQDRLSGILHKDFHPNNDGFGRIFAFMSTLTQDLKQNENSSIQSIVSRFVSAKIFQEPPQASQSAIAVLFACLGTMTMLYTPLTSVGDSLAVNTRDAPCFKESRINMYFSCLPTTVLLREMGDLLPRREVAEGPRNVVHMASINFTTLSRIGGIKLRWVDDFSSHLTFDPGSSILYIFRFPSFCNLHSEEKTFLSRYLSESPVSNPMLTTSSVVRKYYGEGQQPPDFSVKNFMKEILRTYEILFGSSRKARNLYRNAIHEHQKETKRTGVEYISDPYLDELCLGTKKYRFYNLRRPIKESFEAMSEFPILAQRLLRIQHYIDGFQSNKISSLWRDRRDMLRWYTFWAVIVLGLWNVLVAMAQCFLAAEQVQLAREAANPIQH